MHSPYKKSTVLFSKTPINHSANANLNTVVRQSQVMEEFED